MRAVAADPAFEFSCIVTGSHLSEEFGKTVSEIENEGLEIDERVPLPLGSESISKCISVAISGFDEAYQRLNPDILVLLGDRFEIFAAAVASIWRLIPIAHIHGGELTEGLVDDVMRHSISKMSHLHFVAAEPYRRRVVQLGEDPARVFLSGALALDNLRTMKLLERDELEEQVGIKLRKPFFLVTYHPVTLEKGDPAAPVRELFRALDEFPEASVLFTRANADAGGGSINREIEAYVARFPERMRLVASLGHLRYMSALRLADAVVGNSSSGLIEAPFFRKPTINIGRRQGGRLKASTVIDCGEDLGSISRAMRQALDPVFVATLAGSTSPYDQGGAAAIIVDTLKKTDLAELCNKRFHDVAFQL